MKHKTVAELIEFLRTLPPDWVVGAYEGEGGESIMVGRAQKANPGVPYIPWTDSFQCQHH